jgi:hypothetical protein
MKLLEEIGKCWKMDKVMLTVFKGIEPSANVRNCHNPVLICVANSKYQGIQFLYEKTLVSHSFC